MIDATDMSAGTAPLAGSVRGVWALNEAERRDMFALYDTYYVGADLSAFLRDLDDKTYAVLLHDAHGRVRGFSTLKVFDHEHGRILYSGDTIIDKAWWGRNDFAQVWLKLAGSIRAERPDLPLYWLLIVKGHRTYRYLSLFARDYYPKPKAAGPTELKSLMDDVATVHFGPAYVADKGLVFFPAPRSYLREELVPILPKDRARADVQYFLEKNPGYAKGDELVCFCDLQPDNLTRLSRGWFEEGEAEASYRVRAVC